MSVEGQVNQIRQSVMGAAISRRGLVRQTLIAGLSVPTITALLVACGDDDTDDDDEDVEAEDDPDDDGDPVVEPDPDDDDDDPVVDEEPETDDEEPIDDEEDDEPTADDDTPRRGGQLLLTGSSGAELDPHLAGEGILGAGMVYDSLFHYAPDPDTELYELQPDLVEAWDFAEDGAYVDLELQQDVSFHDGSPWNAETAKWNIERLRDHDQSVARPQWEHVTDAEVIDDNTVRLYFEEAAGPPALIPPAMHSQIVSMEAVESMGDLEFGRNPVGTGPMSFVEWVIDSSVTIEANPDYWRVGDDGEPLPYLDGAVTRYPIDLEQALTELRAGTVHAYAHPPARDVGTIEDDPELGHHLIPGLFRANLSRFMINMNVEPFTDIQLREAALHALDTEGFSQAVGVGVTTPHDTLWWAPGILGYDEEIRGPEFDSGRARQIMEEAGYGDGVDVSLKIINRPDDVRTAQVIKQMLDTVDIRTQIDSVERTTWIDDLREGDFQLSFIGTSLSPDPVLVSSHFVTGGSANWHGYSNEGVDQLMREAAILTDDDERAELYKEVQRLMHADAAMAILAIQPGGWAQSNRLRNARATRLTLDMTAAWLDE